ncbi:hypothetical protein [Streptomyces antimicrobicus]|uniref:Sigma-70 family RNA polymerase sigma factor n=1 Tax=Streptomyces antimicrobicus TaxID=2883108 RepID=A0ABS8BE75_9ACTN|nr:hypothetical protein [Streptomyces antimicrobicus]MCB5182829.1 hypothetical protein [Streptomyces antimicrobicus]
MPTELEGEGIAVRPPLHRTQLADPAAPHLAAAVGAGEDAEDAERRAARLLADARIVEVLRADGFAGPRYDRFVERLTGYGWATMVKWCASGEIFRRALAAGRPVPRHMIVADWSQDDRLEVSTDSVIDGLLVFRRYGLVEGRWDPAGGANLTTYYMGAVIRAFTPVYRTWYEDRRTGQAELCRPGREEDGDGDPMAAIPDQRAPDPYQCAAVHDEIRRLLPRLTDPQVREGLGWYAVGCTQAQAAQRVGLTRKALERRTHRLRTRLNDDGGRQQEPGEGATR